jgi:hypothetical protein
MCSSRERGAFAWLVRVAVFVLLFCGFAEVLLRTAIPACQTPNYYQQDPRTIVRRDPEGPTSGLFTVGRLCLRGGNWRVNNAGWNSGVDYFPDDHGKRPLIALFGDSHVEGFLTDVDEHVDAYLPQILPGTSAYAFGLAGIYLEQCVAVSRYARARFQPDVLVVFIGVGDVSDSLRINGVLSPFWWQIAQRGATFTEVPPPSHYQASRKVDLAKKSALLNYLRYNAHLALPGAPNAAVAQPVARVSASNEECSHESVAARWRGLLPAANFMVSRLCADNRGTPIVFVSIDAQYLPLKEILRTPLAPDIEAVRVASSSHPQCSFIDLRHVFSRDWAAHHHRFDAADGTHWNAYANRLVARELAEFIAENGLLDGQK